MPPVIASDLIMSHGEIVFVLIVSTLIMFYVLKGQEW